MSKSDEKTAREQRLATKLRENLKRRKGQAKVRAKTQVDVGSEPRPVGSKGDKAY